MKTAMIWGASGGIGRAMLKTLHDDGWTVLAVARETGAVEASAKVLIEADVASASSVQDAVTSASQNVSSIDLWVYAIGDIVSEKKVPFNPPKRALSPEEIAERILAAHHDGHRGMLDL